MSPSAPRAESTRIGMVEALPNRAAHLHAVDIRQTQIEHDEIGLVAIDRLDGRASRHRRVHVVAARTEQRRHGAEDVRLVVDDQDSRGHDSVAHRDRPRRPGNDDGEPGAGTGHVLAPDPAARRRQEAARDRESHAGARASVVAPCARDRSARTGGPARSGSRPGPLVGHRRRAGRRAARGLQQRSRGPAASTAPRSRAGATAPPMRHAGRSRSRSRSSASTRSGVPFESVPDLRRGRVDDVGRRDPLRIEVNRRRIDAGHVQNVLEQSRQAIQLHQRGAGLCFALGRARGRPAGFQPRRGSPSAASSDRG